MIRSCCRAGRIDAECGGGRPECGPDGSQLGFSGKTCRAQHHSLRVREADRLLLLLRVDDGGHDAGLDVIDVAGDQHVGGDLVGPQHSLDIGADRAGRLQDGCVREGSLIDARSLGEACRSSSSASRVDPQSVW